MRAEELALRVCQGRGVDIEKYNQIVLETAEQCGLRVNTRSLSYKSGEAKLLEVTSDLEKCDRVFIQTNGFHGNETPAFLSAVVNLPGLAQAAKDVGVGIKVYPLVNPLGAALGIRYNPDDDAAVIPNGDFVRYHLTDGQVVDDLEERTEFDHWTWSIDQPGYLPPETRLLGELLRAEKRRIVGVMDNHADLKIGDPATDLDCPAMYAYVFRNPRRYFSLAKLARIVSGVPFWRKKPVSTEMKEGLKTDGNGFIQDRHDGSVIDWADRLGIESLTVEVSGDTPLNQAAQVYVVWSIGFLGLAARR